jgi:hypothetical protein
MKPTHSSLIFNTLLILSFCLPLSVPSYFFPSSFITKIVYLPSVLHTARTQHPSFYHRSSIWWDMFFTASTLRTIHTQLYHQRLRNRKLFPCLTKYCKIQRKQMEVWLHTSLNSVVHTCECTALLSGWFNHWAGTPALRTIFRLATIKKAINLQTPWL